MFRIGVFSKIAHVATSQLRYYDEIGLLKPAHIDPFNGHRFYNIEQLPRLNRILALKDLGLTLDQIRRLIDDPISAEEMRGMLTMKKAQIEQALHEELMRFYRVDARLQQIESAESEHHFDVAIKTVPEQKMLSVREVFTTFVASQQLLRQIYPVAQQHPALSAYILIVHSETDENGAVDLELGFLVEGETTTQLAIPDSTRSLELQTLPSVEAMAILVYQGDSRGILAGYGALGQWVQANHYQISGSPREVYWSLETSDDEQMSVMVEIQFPVETQMPNFKPADKS